MRRRIRAGKQSLDFFFDPQRLELRQSPEATYTRPQWLLRKIVAASLESYEPEKACKGRELALERRMSEDSKSLEEGRLGGRNVCVFCLDTPTTEQRDGVASVSLGY